MEFKKSAAGKVQMILDLMGNPEHKCEHCGHINEGIEAVITPKEAINLLNDKYSSKDEEE